MLYKTGFIKNFPKSYSLVKKIWSNVQYFAGRKMIHRRNTWLSTGDFIEAEKKIKPGDVVLVGGLRRLSSLIIGGIATHSLLYVGGNKFIHSMAYGVDMVTLDELFQEYDTMIIVRYKHFMKNQIKKMIKYSKAQLGKPYDFNFLKDDGEFYCTELIYFAFKNAGIDLEVFDKSNYLGLATHLRSHPPIHPTNYIGGQFDIIFTSHNIKVEQGGISLLRKKR